jgi:hypothetical protein
MHECGYRKITIDESNSIEVEHINGSIYYLYYNTNDDTDNDDTDNDNNTQQQLQQLQSQQFQSQQQKQQRKRQFRKQPRKQKKVRRDNDDDYNDDNDYNDDVVMIESEKEKDKGKKIETEEEETEEEEDDKEKIEEKGGKIRKKEHPFPNFVKEMGRNLNVLLHNINKLPTPPPTNDINKVSKHNYRSALIKHLAEIESNNEFSYQTEIFANIGYKKKSRKGSLSFILYDEKEEEEEDND